MRRIVRIFTAAFLILALLTQALYAQQSMMMAPNPQALSAAEKAEIAEKEAAKKAADESYQATIKMIPDAKRKADPWATMRSPATK